MSASRTFNTSKGFTGQYNDSLTGLDYYGARYYDPVVGVFLSADTVQGNPQGMNPYAYVGGNPETYYDPTGNFRAPSAESEVELGVPENISTSGGPSEDTNPGESPPGNPSDESSPGGSSNSGGDPTTPITTVRAGNTTYQYTINPTTGQLTYWEYSQMGWLIGGGTLTGQDAATWLEQHAGSSSSDFGLPRA